MYRGFLLNHIRGESCTIQPEYRISQSIFEAFLDNIFSKFDDTRGSGGPRGVGILKKNCFFK